jgi:hypothetical protein
MKSRIAMLAVISLLAVFVSQPAHLHGQQAATAQDHAQHHPEAAQPPAAAAAPAGDAKANMMSMMARMKATDPKLDELVKKMNAAKGSAKTDAIAELLTAIVEDRRTTCEPMMANMMSTMNMMGGGANHGEAAPTNPHK